MTSKLPLLPVLQVAVDVPWRGLGLFDYWPPVDQDLPPDCIGLRVMVPWGARHVVGLVMGVSEHSAWETEKIRHAVAVFDDIPQLDAAWRRLVYFTARYYKHSVGEVALQSLPTAFKDPKKLTSVAVERAWKKLQQLTASPSPVSADVSSVMTRPTLTIEQQHAVQACRDAHQQPVPTPLLLHGVTGSGKTEVYLQVTADVLAHDRQVLILVPEINLTPQLLERFQRRFPHRLVVALHSELSNSQRTLAWLAAMTGKADIVLGTRLAVLAPMPRLGLIVVDEEHDPSYKQQEGVHYSARDLAVWRAHDVGIPVVLGSATPSLDSWRHAEQGKYRRLRLTQRAVGTAVLPTVKLINTAQDKPEHGLTRALRDAIDTTLAAGQQTLIFLNRRGFAPILSCAACGWLAGCPRCSVYVVVHKTDRRLHCHHCGWQAMIPRACPDCGNVDLAPLGRGTQRLEETLLGLYPTARIARLDADSGARKGSVDAVLQRVHQGEIDILIGTQMVAKGHDFVNVGLVGVVDADAALFSHDFRAAERLFAQLHQVIGRAGRHADAPALAIVQTRYPQHPLYQALVKHDDEGFFQQALAERREADLPPLSYQAVLRAEAKTVQQAIDFLVTAKNLLVPPEGLRIYDAVPLALVRVANVERAQLVVESSSRALLQHWLDDWLEALAAVKTSVRWRIEVDPAGM